MDDPDIKPYLDVPEDLESKENMASSNTPGRKSFRSARQEVTQALQCYFAYSGTFINGHSLNRQPLYNRHHNTCVKLSIKDTSLLRTLMLVPKIEVPL